MDENGAHQILYPGKLFTAAVYPATTGIRLTWTMVIVGIVCFVKEVCESAGRGGDAYYEYAGGLCIVGRSVFEDTMDGDGDAVAGRARCSEKGSCQVDGTASQ